MQGKQAREGEKREIKRRAVAELKAMLKEWTYEAGKQAQGLAGESKVKREEAGCIPEDDEEEGANMTMNARTSMTLPIYGFFLMYTME